jgi:hypothetical protein
VPAAEGVADAAADAIQEPDRLAKSLGFQVVVPRLSAAGSATEHFATDHDAIEHDAIEHDAVHYAPDVH